MRKSIFISIIILISIIFSNYSNLNAERLISNFQAALSNKEYIEYKSDFRIYSNKKLIDSIKGCSVFKKYLSDTLIGYKIYLKDSLNFLVYNSNDFFSYSQIHKDTICLLSKNFDSIGFHILQYLYSQKNHAFLSHSEYKINLYDYSIFNMLNDINEISYNMKLIYDSDTTINGYQIERIKFLVSNNPKKNKDRHYYIFGFDKSTSMLVYFHSYNQLYETECFFYDYNFDKKNDEDYFSKKIFPKGFTILNDSTYLEYQTVRNNFNGLSLELTKTDNQYSLNMGIFGIPDILAQGKKRFSLQINFLGIDFIRKDKNNNDYENYSYLTDYCLLWLFAVGLPASALTHNFSDYKPYVTSIVLAPYFLCNSRFGFVLDQRNTSNFYFLTTSFYAKSKLDYFGKYTNKFWKYNPGIGLEISHTFKHDIIEYLKNIENAKLPTTFNVSLNLGLAYPMEFIKDHHPNMLGFKPEFSLVLALGL